MIAPPKPWEERETDLLSALRTCCSTNEITEILTQLSYDRTKEAISRKSRRLGKKFEAFDEPVGEFTEAESAVIDAVIEASNERKLNIIPIPTTSVEIKKVIEESYADNVEEPDHWEPEYIDPDPAEWAPLPDDVPWAPGSLPLKEGRPTKFIMINDVHVPHNIPLDAIWEFTKDFKPDYMLLVGDIVNNDPFTPWERNRRGQAKSIPVPKPYYKECNEKFYRPMREAAGKDCTVVHWEGNHEFWSRAAIQDIPEGEGYWEVWNNVEGVDLWVPSKMFARLGRLYFTHGDVIKGGMNHAKKMLGYFRRSVRYGHYHDTMACSETSPIDLKDRHTAKCCGTLEKFNPHFMKNRPHDWQHTFSFGYVYPEGYFFDSLCYIINNRFIANGKEYVSKEA